MSSFSVTPASVSAQGGAAGEIASTLAGLASSPPIDDASLGQGGVGDTISAFFKEWNYEISQLVKNMETLKGNLERAAEYYEETNNHACLAAQNTVVTVPAGSRSQSRG